MNYEFHRTLFVVVLLILGIAISSLFTGCASPEAYRAYLNAHAAAVKNQKPMLKITAMEGQPITGLKSIEVYGPGLAPQQEKDNEWARVVSGGIQTIGVVGGIAAAGQASRQLVDAVGGLGITSSASTITTTTDNRTWDTHAITDSYNQTANPTVVTQPPAQIVNPVIVQPVVVQP